jgi:glucokinase
MSRSREIVSKEKARSPLFVGLDLGGTNIKLGVVDDLGQTLSYLAIRTEVERGPDDAARRMGEAIHAAIREAGLTPADVVRVGLGSGQGYKSLILLTLGTGIGCGIILGDLILDGAHSHGGEFGHSIISFADDARQCGCKKRGHFEAYASATAVTLRTQEALDAGRVSSLTRRVAAGDELSPKLVAEEATAGDALSLEIILETAAYLGVGIVTLMHTIDPEVILLGGAMTFGGKASPLGRKFLARVQEEIHRCAYKFLAERTAIDFAALGGDAGYLGAAGIARRDYLKGQAS